MVMELADGDLRGTYAKPLGGKDEYTFQDGLKVVVGAAKGLAYMHSMPSPVLVSRAKARAQEEIEAHRDIVRTRPSLRSSPRA